MRGFIGSGRNGGGRCGSGGFFVGAFVAFDELGEAVVAEVAVGEHGGAAGEGGGDFFDGALALGAVGQWFGGHGLEVVEALLAVGAAFVGCFVAVYGHGGSIGELEGGGNRKKLQC